MRNHAAHALFLATALLLLSSSTFAQVVPTAIDKVNITPPNYKVPHFLEGSLDTLAAAHITLIDLITIEYPYSPDHIYGLTPEQRNTRFDVVAKIDPPCVSDPEHDPHAYSFMIHALLKNHFRLVVHETGKPYEQLMLISNAAKPGPCPPPSSTPTADSGDHTASACISMDELATRLSNELHIDVVNRTNLPGKFPIGVNWPGPIAPSAIRGGHPPQSLQAALKAYLGLMLVPELNQNQTKTLVVDYVELPAILEQTRTAAAN